VWSIRAKLDLERRLRDLALFNLAIDSKLRGCDLISLRVSDVAPNGYAVDRANVRQKKTGRPVRFELTEQTRQSVDQYLRSAGRVPAQFLFPGRGGPDRSLTTRQYARLVARWVSSVGLDPRKFATHSMRRTKATLIYRRTGNLRAVQLWLGHIRIDYVPYPTMSRRGMIRFVMNAERVGTRDIVHVVKRTRNVTDEHRGTSKCRLQDVLLAGGSARP
jgi:integrase